MLKMGRSKLWPEALEKMTGYSQMDVGPLHEYFMPLRSWLIKQRCDKKYPIGWPGDSGPSYDPCNPPSFLPTTHPAPNPRSKACVTDVYGIMMVAASVFAHITSQFAV